MTTPLPARFPVSAPRAQASARASRSPATRQRVLLVGLAMGLCVLFFASLLLGSVNIPLSDIVAVLSGNTASREAYHTIILSFRLPKAITAILAGAALATAGLQMQTLFRNPLADPFVLGISSGASLGVALVILTVGVSGTTLLAGLGIAGDLAVTLAASMGASLAMIVVLTAARVVRGTTTLLIFGVMFGYLAGALVSMMAHFTIPERLQAFSSWTYGSFSTVTWSQMPVFACAIGLGLVAALFTIRAMNAFLLGETYAASMGIDVRRQRLMIMLGAALLTGTVTAFCGPIAFLGLAIPHLCRALLRQADHRWMFPACMLLGGSVALIADAIAQLPGNQVVLPLNAVTALIGAPIVIAFLLRRVREHSA
jgi:iron complex transport system permease protein